MIHNRIFNGVKLGVALVARAPPRFYYERFFIVYFMSFAGVNMSRTTDLQVATVYEYERLFSKLCTSIRFICIKKRV